MRTSISDYQETTHYHSLIKAISTDPTKAIPTVAEVYKTGIYFWPKKQRANWLQRSADYGNVTQQQLLSGEKMPTVSDGLIYLIVASMIVNYCYNEPNLIKFMFLQVEMINIMLKFLAFRGSKFMDKVILCEQFIDEMTIRRKAATESYTLALGCVNKPYLKTNLSSDASNNNNHNFNNNHFNKKRKFKNNNNNNYRYNNRNKYKNGPNTDIDRKTYHKLLYRYCKDNMNFDSSSDSDNNNNIKPKKHNNKKKKNQKKKAKPHMCDASFCKDPNCQNH